MIGLPKSPSSKPTARSMARLGVRWTPSVMTALLSLVMAGEDTRGPGRLATGPADLLGGRLEGVALHLVGRNRGQGGVVLLARSDPDHPVERLHEDLAVSYFTGPGGGENGVDRGFHERLRDRHLDLHLLSEFEHDRRGAVVLDQIALTPVAAHPADGDSGDPSPKQRGLDFSQAFGPDDAGDQFHSRASCGAGRYRLSAIRRTPNLVFGAGPANPDSGGEQIADSR